MEIFGYQPQELQIKFRVSTAKQVQSSRQTKSPKANSEQDGAQLRESRQLATQFITAMPHRPFIAIFSAKENRKKLIDAKTVVENANMVYNNIAVHPRTGKVYMTTIKAYGWDFLINNISVFGYEGEEMVLSDNYKNYTHFPAGIFFPADFAH